MPEPLVVYHPRSLADYPTVSVECPARVARIHEALAGRYPMVEPDPARPADLRRVHAERLIASVRQEQGLFEVAALAAGGALRAAREAAAGRPAFGLIRPPGHHASPDHHWGFCFFNNMAVALTALLAQGAIRSAFVLDFDLHFGDGTDNCFRGDKRVQVFNPQAGDRAAYVGAIAAALEKTSRVDIFGVSAGFDNYELDWGGLLCTPDFQEIGRLVKAAAGRLCGGRRFALLEGGYYLPDLGANALAFCQGFF